MVRSGHSSFRKAWVSMWRRVPQLLGFALLAPIVLGGCSKTPPAVVEVHGVVLLDGQPLPHATVQFMPLLEHFGAEYNSHAITDEQGRFSLTCSQKNQSGAVVAMHKVLIADHIPDEYRSQRGETQDKLA